MLKNSENCTYMSGGSGVCLKPREHWVLQQSPNPCKALNETEQHTEVIQGESGLRNENSYCHEAET